MSFTEDELQAFNSILEQRFAAHRQEMEQALDQRLESFRQDINQRLVSLQRETASVLKQEMVDSKEKPGPDSMAQLHEEPGQNMQLVEAALDRRLTAQLESIEQLLNQHASQQNLEAGPLVQNLQSQLESIEVQTELPWADLVALVGKELDERLVSLNDVLQHSVKNLEQYLAVRLHSLRDEIALGQGHERPYSGQIQNGTSVAQEVLAGVEHLERVMESMQVAMTANHALLSDRLYHHQKLPLERAHLAAAPQITETNESPSLLVQAKEHAANGLEPDLPVQQDEDEEVRE